MNNIFKDAYFGKEYRTRDDKKAIFHRNANDKVWYLIKEDIHERIPYNADGTCRGDNCHDVVAEWQEPVDVEELRKEIEEYAENMMIIHCKEHHIDCPNHIIKDALRRAYEDGRRKEKEDKQ